MIKQKLGMITVLLSLFIISAQDISVSPDFTGTDIHGKTYNLFSILDQGKHVWIHTTGKW